MHLFSGEGLSVIRIAGDSVGEVKIALSGSSNQNVSISIWSMNESGPSLILGAPSINTNVAGLAHQFSLGRLADGLYIGIIEEASASGGFPILANPVGKQGFIVSNQSVVTDFPIQTKIAEAIEAQLAFRNREVRAPSFVGDNRMRVAVLVDRCNLDYQQLFEGGELRPLKNKLRPSNVFAAVDEIFGTDFKDNGQPLERSFGIAHPMCLVTFVNVQASDADSAIRTVLPRLARVLGVLAEDRLADPQPLAYVVTDAMGGMHMNLHIYPYYGNLVGGFGPETTPLLDLVETAAKSEPWVEFALNLMRSIRQQRTAETQLFMAWSLIEAGAKRRVSKSANVVHDDQGAPLKDGRNDLTESKDIGRVLIYLRDHVGRDILGLHKGGPLDFYDQVRLAYACRNLVAHEGGIEGPGKIAPAGYDLHFASTVTDWASAVFRYECREHAKPGSPII